MNSITVTGKLMSDPMNRTVGDKMVVSILVGEYAGKDNAGNYRPAPVWRCEIWGNRAQVILDRAHKGTLIALCARVKRDKYTGKDGAEVDQLKLDVYDFDISVAASAPASPPADDNPDEIPF